MIRLIVLSLFILSITRSSVIIMKGVSKRVLVLGGTGFVGNRFVNRAASKGFQIVSLSRRGTPAAGNQNYASVQWVKGDAVDPETMDRVYREYGPFDACVHAVGLLFDSQSGLKSLNIYASGSKSVAADDATYDRITRMTAFNAIDAFAKQQQNSTSSCTNAPFLFVSAAEASWTFDAPVNWLQRYLEAKRAVEGKLLGLQDTIRPVIFRPSMIWTKDMPSTFISAAPFYVGSALSIPIVDRPVQVESLVDAMISSIENAGEVGIKNFREIDRLSAMQKA